VHLKVEVIESREALDALEPEWRGLWQCDQAASPFESPAWLLPWTRHLWGGGKLRVLAVRNGRDLVGLAPLFLWGYGCRPEVVRVSLLGAGITDHLGMLAAPGFEQEAARLVFERLAEMSEQWHLCDLEELRPGSPLLRAEFPRGLSCRNAPSGVCPVLALPKTAEDLYSGLQPKFRKNLRQAEARLRRDGAEFVLSAPNQTADVMRALFRLHTARWEERRQPGMLAADVLQQFHLAAADRLAGEGMLQLYSVRLRGEIIAAQYNLRRDRRIYYYLSGFDPAHARYSPGAALLSFIIRTAIEEGATEFDFLRKREEYKYQWGARDRVSRRLLLTPSVVYARDVA